MKPGQIGAQFETKDGRRIVLRSLRTGDLDALIEFANAVVKEKKTNRNLGIVSFDAPVTPKKEREFLRAVVEGVKEHEKVSVAAWEGGVLVGHCEVTRGGPNDVRHTGVLGIIIRAGYRNVGIGERMILEAQGEAQRMGVWLVELRVFAINEIAIHLYKKLGFQEVGTVPNKMIRGETHFDEVVMYTDLRKR